MRTALSWVIRQLVVVISFLRFGTTYWKTDRLSRNMLVKILKIKTQNKIKIHLLVVYTLYISLPTLFVFSLPCCYFIILHYCKRFCVYVAFSAVHIA